MNLFITYLTVILLLTNITIVHSKSKNKGSKSRYPEPKLQQVKPKSTPKINIDLLPPLENVLESLGLTRFYNNFVKMGVYETRLLVRLSAMDFQIMSYDWDGITKEEILKLKEEIKSLIIQATVVEDVIRPEIAERKKLTYGRIYMIDSVQSYEYISASFGGPPNIGKFKVEIPSSIYGCNDEDITNYEGTILILKRGECSFLNKADFAKKYNASGLIIVNSEDRLDAPSSGLGVNKNITDNMVHVFKDLPIVAVSNTSWAKLEHTITSNKRIGVTSYVDIVPLKCKPGGKCIPLLEEEKQLQPEVSWGTMRIKGITTTENSDILDMKTKSFEFLTSNYGSQLPVYSSMQLRLAYPDIQGCSTLSIPPLQVINHIGVDGNIDDSSNIIADDSNIDDNYYKNKAIVVHRGGCRFDIKALHAQEVGADMLIIVDIDDNALQRVGGKNPEAGYVGIPSIIVTLVAGKFIHSLLENNNNNATIEVIPARDSIGSDMWIELAITEWAEDDNEQIMQIEGLIQKYSQSKSNEIVAWLHRKLDKLVYTNKKSIDTDGY